MSFSEHNVNGVVYTASDLFTQAGGVIHGFSTRLGGVSTGHLASMNLGTTRGDNPEAVRENYRRFFSAVGADLNRIIMSKQVHGDCIRTATSADIKQDLYDPEGYETDGLVTDLPGAALVIFSADCIPVLLYDPVRRVIGAAHAGWRGTAAGIAAKAAQAMMDRYGCQAGDLLAAIGPGISKCCFETHADVANAMMDALGMHALPYLTTLPAGKFRVDLKGLNARWLINLGVPEERIDLSEACTACLPEKYWSHRVVGEQRGSQIAVLQLQS
ncbi:MAG: peptidoglycan editing factor PgeF [Oscillospiraceae bacterium]|nr:peptidoglycan editing factor PgeF [Oscillospiraceae bacterium]